MCPGIDTIQTLQDDSYDIPTSCDGSIYQVSSPDCVVGGIGNEFNITYTSDSLSVTVGTGEASICGSFFRLKQASTLSLDPSQSSGLYICLTINMSQLVGNRGSITVKTQSDIDMTTNINNSASGIRDLPIWKIITNSSGVAEVVDYRKIITRQPLIQKVTALPTDTFGYKDGDLFILVNQ